jgi:hypothetical protein
MLVGIVKKPLFLPIPLCLNLALADAERLLARFNQAVQGGCNSQREPAIHRDATGLASRGREKESEEGSA